MSGSGGHRGARAGLADQVGPVRTWLMRYFSRRVSSDTDIEDLVQDVFARIVARDGARPVEHLGSYIAKTASSVLTDWARRRAVRKGAHHVAFDPELHSGEELDPERVVSGREELHAATAALLGLPERTRTVFVLNRLEGQKHREIASRLGISVSAVEKHMVRAIDHLSTEMEKYRGS